MGTFDSQFRLEDLPRLGTLSVSFPACLSVNSEIPGWFKKRFRKMLGTGKLMLACASRENDP